MKLRKICNETSNPARLYQLQPVKKVDAKVKKAMQEGMVFEIFLSEKEAEALSKELAAGKIMALWRANWDLENIASDTRTSELTTAKVIAAAIQYPDLFIKKEEKEQEEEEDAF